MSDDLKNSLLLWVGAVVFVGLFWAGLHFNLAPGIPDHWNGPIVGILIALNVLKAIWDYVRKRKARNANLVIPAEAKRRAGTPAHTRIVPPGSGVSRYPGDRSGHSATATRRSSRQLERVLDQLIEQSAVVRP